MKKLLYGALCGVLMAPSALMANLIMIYKFRNELLVDAAAKNNDRAALALLSIAGTDPNSHDTAGKTPLHYTAENGKLALSQALLLRGADPTITDLAGDTPRSLARKKGHDEIELLLSEWFKPVQSA